MKREFCAILPPACWFRFEQASGADSGKTWETNWMMEFARAK
jgi:hypothetical protein